MDNLFQPVSECYPNYVFEKLTSPSYVEMYTKGVNEIALVYFKPKQTNPVKDCERNNSKEVEELELTGSPLKLDLSLHTTLDDTVIPDEPQLWRKEEIFHGPINVEKAREIANCCNKILSKLPPEESVSTWILCNPSDDGKPLLLTVQSDDSHFARGIVSYEGSSALEEIDVENLMMEYAAMEQIEQDMVDILVDCKYILSGIKYGALTTDELLNTPHGGATELHCNWTSKTLITPFISCKVQLEQEVVIGHMASPCNTLWKSVTSLHNINQILVDMTAAGQSSIALGSACVRHIVPGMKKLNNSKRLTQLLNETENYTYTAEHPVGGFLPITEDTSSLRQCLTAMATKGSSNDFTYKLWDILRDCETAEELIALLIQALKFVSSGKIRPFIDVNNKSYLSKLVLKLSRGHSQAAKVLHKLSTGAAQALSLIAQVVRGLIMLAKCGLADFTHLRELIQNSQVGVEKCVWEYSRLVALHHVVLVANLWNADARSHESIEQINQTIHDMSMGGDFTLNPFESLSTAENSIRLDSESFCIDNPNELTVDDFASLKKHGLATEKKDVNEVPLIADEIDISPWKNLLMKFAQVHVCLEHLYRAENCLRADFTQLKPMASKLFELYVSEKSPIKTVGQLMSDPVQRICVPVANTIVQDHLKKPAFWYRLELTRKDNAKDIGIRRDSKVVYVFSQQPVFPPPVWQHLEPTTEDVAEVTTIGEEVKYHTTKYTFLNNKILRKLNF